LAISPPAVPLHPKVGWNNDPNGMVWHDGKWHLFFQHNTAGWGENTLVAFFTDKGPVFERNDR
jgi:sucrose-6-phosphate hydrolase SacC (GH32 family)